MSERASDQARKAGELTRHRERLDSRTSAPSVPTLGEGSTGSGYIISSQPWGETGAIVDLMVTAGVGQDSLFPLFELKCPSRPAAGQDVQWRIGSGGVLEIIGGGSGGDSSAYYTGIIPTGWPVSGG